ncbi:hypothetical protein Q31b_10330 [Novipirellula aureliae]|uniref:Uncharacterized protein n=1 Tax=Novipirellula aureliae TaxID=2527966 RepID=A0A5C6ED10_9BACT|nr:hypothetical protein [Novipirellula aureliae]TWU45857.1 hypothetical protein Q31b_10330 [Novipirellula aureliae]
MQNDRKAVRRGEDLENRRLEFAARVGKRVDALPDTPLGRHSASQLVCRGTSPAPNDAEAMRSREQARFSSASQSSLQKQPSKPQTAKSGAFITHSSF